MASLEALKKFETEDAKKVNHTIDLDLIKVTADNVWRGLYNDLLIAALLQDATPPFSTL